jgi:hypothetical protein
LAAFQHDIAMGVRRGDDGLRRAPDRTIAAKEPQITRLLHSFGVPLMPDMGIGERDARNIAAYPFTLR